MSIRSKRCIALTAAIAAAAGIGSGSAAHAQRVQRPFAIKFGVRFPTDNVVRDEIGTAWTSFGLSYDIAQTRRAKPVVPQVYLDYSQRAVGSADRSDSTYFTGTLGGIGGAVKFSLAPATESTQPYVGVGVGYYEASVPAYGIHPFGGSQAPISVIGSRTARRYGGKIFAGYHFNPNFFGEADYTYVGAIDGIPPGGASLRIGIRF